VINNRIKGAACARVFARGLLIVSLASWGMAANTPAVAQSDEAGPRLEEIVVTARKRSEDIQSIPVSVTAFSAAAIEERGLTNLQDLSRFTPGFYFSDGRFGRDQDRPTMRGMTNLRPETQQVVSLFIDGVYVRGNTSSVLLDNLERVEIVKGPQSALYGRATFAGAVNYITRDPAERLSGDFSASIGQNERYDIKAGLSGPLFGDTVSAGLAVRHYEYGGAWVDSSALNAGRSVGNQETNSVALTLVGRPSDQLKLKLYAAYSEDRDGQAAAVLVPGPVAACGPGRANPTRTRVVASCGKQPTNLPTAYNFEHFDLPYVPGDIGMDRKTVRFNFLADYSLGNHTLQWVSGWSREEEVWGNDTSYDAGPVRDAFGRDARFWSSIAFEELHYWSTDLRITSPAEGRVRWLAGASYYEDSIPEPLFGIIANLAPGGTGFEVRAAQENTTWGVYGQVVFDFTEHLTGTIEARYFEEEVYVFGSNAGMGVPYDLRDTFDWLTPRATVEFRPREAMMFYMQAARGAKAGGFNATPGFGLTNPNLLVFQPETLWSYELGTKTGWLDDRLIVNGAVYFIDWKDQQIAQLLTYTDLTGQQRIGTIVGNAGKTEIRGFEIEARARLTDQFSLTLGYSYTDAEFTAGTDSQNGTILGNPNLAGLKVPQVPKQTATISGEWRTPQLFGSWGASVRSDLAYASTRYAEVQNLIETGDELVGNVSASLRGERVTLTAYVDNVFDEDSATNVFRFNVPETFQRTAVVTLRRPREAGVRFEYRF
jgi:outer membrane receptor protein involved in Fe transport